MAVLIGPLHSSEARGAVGGLVYNTHRGRAYVKANVAPSTQYSDPQVNMRAHMTPVIAAWQALSDQARLDWSHYASSHLLPSWTGSDKRISGWNWFAKCNFRLQYAGLTLRLNPPDANAPQARVVSVTDTTTPDYTIDWDTSPPDPSPQEYLFVWLVGPHSPGASPTIKLAALQGHVAYDGGGFISGVPSAGMYTVFAHWINAQGVQSPIQRLPMLMP